MISGEYLYMVSQESINIVDIVSTWRKIRIDKERFLSSCPLGARLVHRNSLKPSVYNFEAIMPSTARALRDLISIGSQPLVGQQQHSRG